VSNPIHDVFIVIAAATAWVVGAGMLGAGLIAVPALLLARAALKRRRARRTPNPESSTDR
jgi:hypothetical protein